MACPCRNHKDHERELAVESWIYAWKLYAEMSAAVFGVCTVDEATEAGIIIKLADRSIDHGNYEEFVEMIQWIKDLGDKIADRLRREGRVKSRC